MDAALQNVMFAGGFIFFGFLLLRIVLWTRSAKLDPALWGTMFESLSHYVQPLDALKEPKQFINQVRKTPLQDED